MAATFPGGVKSFTTKVDGVDKIYASHINDIQSEISAVETELLKASGSAVDHDALKNFVGNKHIDHSAVSISAGTGLTGGGTLAANRTLSLSFLGLQDLADPDADRVLFWDDSAGALKWLKIGGITGTTFGQWQAYTPTWTGASINPSVGNGTLSGRYAVFGTVCVYTLGLYCGSTTTFGSGNWSFSLPIAAVNTPGINFYGISHMRKSGTGNYERTAQIAPSVSTNTISLFIDPTPGSNLNNLNSTAPFTWGQGDALGFEITYEIA
jgi:hypothetical protein